MHEPSGSLATRPAGGVERALLVAAKVFALAGGALFLALIVMSLVSIIGRKLANAPVVGDVELMQVGTAVAASAFLPLCTILGEHLRVDFFTESAPVWLRRLLDAIADLILGLLALVVAWRTGLQVIDIRDAGEVTPLLGVPVWMPMAAMVPSFLLVTACAMTRGWRDLTTSDRPAPGAVEAL